MGLFKSSEERRIEREMKVRSGMRAVERSIRQQEKFAEGFIKKAQQARKIGDEQQYAFIRANLKKTATVKRMLERQLLSMETAFQIQQQAVASQQFAQTMGVIAQEIGRSFSELDLTRTQADWERPSPRPEASRNAWKSFSIPWNKTPSPRPPPAANSSAMTRSTA